MYYKNEYLRKTDERIKTLVAKGDIKGLASLANALNRALHEKTATCCKNLLYELL